MTTRLTNLFLGVMALGLGAAGGGIWAAGEPQAASAAVAAVEVAAVPAPATETEAAPCCRKGQRKCSHDEKDAAHAAHAKPAAKKDTAASAAFVCPMHPEVTSGKREDRCPKCGMFLEEAKK